MSIRRIMTVRSLMIFYVAAALSVASCRKQETPPPLTATSPPAVKTGTVAGSPADLERANIHEIINTRGVEAATRSRLGNSRAKDGTVVADVATFKSSDHIYLTMWIPAAPRGLQTSAEWSDEKGKVIRQDRMDAAGATVVTFEWTGKPLQPGKYHVDGYWGGNVAAQHDFTVEPAPAKAARKKRP